MATGAHLTRIEWCDRRRQRRDTPDTIRQEVIRIGRNAYTADGHPEGCIWEITIRQYLLATRPTLRLEAFDDSWPAFTDIPDFLAALTTFGPHPTLDDVATLCTRYGWLDTSEHVQPRH